MDIKEITFCELDIPYDRELFCKEVDEHILPGSMEIEAIDKAGIAQFAHINRAWNMVPESEYMKDNSQKAWLVNSLIYCRSENKYLDMLSQAGSIVTRNRILNKGEWTWKPKYENLELTKFIKNLPLTDIIHARILCLPPGKMAAIHRDDRTDSLSKTLLSDLGYISVTMNLSDGGQPLFYSLDSDEETPILANEPIYTFNDFNFHGVPYVSQMRRQVRVTGKPTPEFFKLLKKVTLKT